MSRSKFDHPNRRRFIAAGLATLGSAVSLPIPVTSRAEEILALRKLAAEKRLLYGTTISARQITGDPRFVDLVLQQTGLVVAENEMKWQVMNRGERGDNDYGPADTIAAFALENHLALRGHNLLWYHRTPSWFFDLDSRQEIESAIVERIRRPGTPVDAVGIQAHLSCAGGPPFSDARLRRFLADVAGLGLTIQITELDVTDENAPSQEAVRDRLVADSYSRFLDPALDE